MVVIVDYASLSQILFSGEVGNSDEKKANLT